MILATVTVIIILIIIIILYFIFNRSRYEYLISSDGIKFKVYKTDNSREAVAILSELNRRVKILMDFTKQIDKEAWDVLNDNYDFDDFTENIDESFTIGKGEKIHICIRDPSNINTFIPINEIMFVVIHELGHVITPEYNHIAQFWRNNNKLLGYAIRAGVYMPIDYARYPFRYCNNLTVNNNPYMDNDFIVYLNSTTIDEKKDII